jgi:hypothetical protein
METGALYEVLEREGIKSPVDVLSLSKLTVKQSRELHQSLRKAIFQFQYASEAEPLDDDYYSFMPSASMRGDAGCSEVVCRAKKLNFLGRFAALYADRLVIPTALSSRPPRLKLEIELELRSACLMLLMHRPLIEERIVIPAVLSTSHCEHQRGFVEETVDLLHEVAMERADEAVKEFDIEYQRPSEDRPYHTVFIHGSEDYIEHGLVVAQFTGNPRWIAPSWRYDGEGKRMLSRQTIRETPFLRSLFTGTAADTTFQLFYGRSLGCKYLTTMAGEVEFLSALNDERQAEKDALIQQSLIHSLPFAESLSIAQVLALRSEIHDSFTQYRTAMRMTVKDFDAPLTRQQAREVFRDRLEPKVKALELSLKKEVSLLNKKSRNYAAFAALVIGLGVAGLLPSAAALSLAGGALAIKMLDTVAERQQQRSTPTNDDLYFLLRLKQLKRRSNRAGK